MFQIGTKNVFLYLPEDEPGIKELGGAYERELKRWRFSPDKKEVVLKFVKDRYPALFDSDFEPSDDESEVEDFKMDQRLRRAKSFVTSGESDESSDFESSDEDEKSRSRSRSHKFKEGCGRYRPKLTNNQFSKKRADIKKRF